jgi:hypothetical protein
MDAVEWTALSVLVSVFVAVVLGAFGYLSRQMDRRFDAIDARLDRLEERYVRHLEMHATGNAT